MAARLKGKVVSVTDAGDLVTDISVTSLADTPRDESVSVHCEGHVTKCIFSTDHDQPDMTFVAIHGSSGFLQLSLVGDSASRFLGIRVGAPVTLEW